MMESNLQITIKGLQTELATSIANAIGEAVIAFKQADEDLDFRRMYRIVITTDFSGELAELSGSTASGNPIRHTDEEYAVAVAKVLILPRGEEFEILLIVNGYVAAALVPEDPEGYQTERFRTVLHLLHHELCHVHDGNKKIDAFREEILCHRYRGKDLFIRPLAEVCWSEYIANYLSSSTANDDSLMATTDFLVDAIKRTKSCIDTEIISYRYHGELDRLMSVFQRHGEFLAKTAAYTLGYIDGLNKELAEFSITAHNHLSGSYFEPIWTAMQTALRNMRGLYPDAWTEISVFDGLASVIENYYARMGLVLSTTEDGQTYIDIPFRPETTPLL
jgi:hypothetical protein